MENKSERIPVPKFVQLPLAVVPVGTKNTDWRMSWRVNLRLLQRLISNCIFLYQCCKTVSVFLYFALLARLFCSLEIVRFCLLCNWSNWRAWHRVWELGHARLWLPAWRRLHVSCCCRFLVAFNWNFSEWMWIFCVVSWVSRSILAAIID